MTSNNEMHFTISDFVPFVMAKSIYVVQCDDEMYYMTSRILVDNTES